MSLFFHDIINSMIFNLATIFIFLAVNKNKSIIYISKLILIYSKQSLFLFTDCKRIEMQKRWHH